ncbi:MAG: biotin--[acetyl-CoA-carboxylase] ligase [Opitutaceae bacterium]|nr:biotin--[acetyl-CoA-carboxylase] ligase [Cytophagales bacterium]
MNNKVSQLSKSPTNNTIWLSTCHSTNSFAQEWIKKNDFEDGWTVSTYEQTNGRGQMGNSWESEPNQNLTFSTVYTFPDLILSNLFFLNIAVSVGIIDYLKNIGFKAEIKWPNDIYLQTKKVAGILIEPHILESKINNVIVGIGLNVNQKKFLNTNAVSLFNISNVEYKIENELEKLLMFVKESLAKLKKGDFDSLKVSYYQKLYLMGKPAAFLSKGKIFMGIIKGVDETGKLIIETENDYQSFNIKEIEFMK